MQKAYEVKALAEKFKARGLDLAEDAAKIVIEETCSWVEESAKLSATPIDDIAIILMPQIKSVALGQVDKIDGKVG